MDKKSNIGDRSRIEGSMHRSLPATLELRAAQGGSADDGLLRLRLSASSETPYLRQSWFDEPWIEVLGHKDGEVDLTRLNDGAPVLANHDRTTAVGNTPLAGIGMVEKAWLENGRLMADLAISRRDALADLRQDISDGLVKNISIGYMINERTLVKANGDGQPDEYRVTSWTPFEISPVDIPADATIGIGRDQESSAAQYRVVDLTPYPGNQKGVAKMETQTQSPEATTTVRSADAVDHIKVERERVREISALGRQFNLGDLTEKAVDSGTSVDAFRELVLTKLKDSGKLRPAESPEIGLTEKEAKGFSFCKALLAAQDPHHAQAIAPFELECSRAAQAKRGDSRDKSREGAITIPTDVLNQSFKRDLTVGAPTGGGNSVATNLLAGSFIDLLRNAMMLDALGITWLRDLNGNIAIPSQTGTATAFWVAESGAVTESQQTVGQVTMTAKTVGAFTDYSRRLLLQSSLDVESFVRTDLAQMLGVEMQRAALHGSGASNEPTGLFGTAGISSVAGGTNGLAPTYDHIVDLESGVANVNAAAGNLAYLTNTKVRGKLRKTQEFASTNGRAVWTTGAEVGVGELLGYAAYATNSVSSTLTKGTSSGVCSAIAFGNWSDLMIGLWGGLDIMLDPYTGALSGTKRVVALQDCDVAVRRAASFGVMLDALTA